MKSIAMIEFRSIARGVEAADIMVKTANVKLVQATTICPGKFLVLISGDTGAVKESLEAGLLMGTPYVVSHTFIPNLSEQVIAGIEGYADIVPSKALAVLEYYAVIDAIIGADIAVKTSSIDIIEIRLGFAIGGKGFVVLTGEIADINCAINAAKEHASESGMLVEACIIPSISKEVLDQIM